MKSIIKDFAHVFYALLFLISTKALSQENYSFTITPELSKQVVEKYKLDDFKIYLIRAKEVERYPYIDGQVPTNDYKRESKRLEQYKPAFDEYMTQIEMYDSKRKAIHQIVKNIDEFLDSNAKYDVKEKLLIDSQTVADKYDIKVSTIDNRLQTKVLTKYVDNKNNTANAPERQILIYEKDKRTNKNDLRVFKEEIQKIKIKEPEETHNYRMYLEVSKEILLIPKTEMGRVLSDKLSKESVYVIEETPVDINVISGDFTELQGKYSLIKEDVAYRFVKNELITKSNEYHDRSDEFNGFPIIKKSGTNELYYIMSNQFILQLTGVVERAKFENLGNTAEYKAWKTKYVGLMQSAQVNVNACNAIIKKHTFLNRIGQKRYDSGTFSKHEKISFNKNLDLLNDKLKQISDLESERDNLSFYNGRASDKEAVESYSLSTYYNTTSRVY